MKSLGRATLLLLLSLQLTQAQPQIESKFLFCGFPYSGGTLPYRLFVPEFYDSTLAYPLVLTLHGNGGQGINNLQINGTRMATAWADPGNQAKHPCFVVAPQCPMGIYDWYEVAPTLSGLLDSLTRAYSIDTNRLYVTGLSMGGIGTWEMITAFPGRFAAAIPVSGGGDPDWLFDFGDTPIWNFHGALDASVPAFYSRVMFAAMEEHGRNAVYTHCLGFECDVLPDSVMAMHISRHADLIYTETQTGEHTGVFFDGSYNNKYLMSWVFDKHRLTPGAVSFTNPATYCTFSGTVSLAWTGGTPGDSVELWFSPDAGRTWRMIERSLGNIGDYSWSTNDLPDCGLGLLNLFLKENTGHIYSRAQSAFFAIDNVGNSAPFVALVRDPRVVLELPFEEDTLTIPFRAADPEHDTMSMSISYSIDRGVTYTEAESFLLPSDSALHRHQMHLGPLANSDQAILRITASDGLKSGSDRSSVFIKRSPRQSGSPACQTVGSSGSVTVNVVDPAQLTNDQYRVVFTDTAEGKWYDVQNITTGGKAISRAAVAFDGVTEGPMFDGIRLVVKDHAHAEVDAANSRWEVGSSSYFFSMSIPVIDMGGYTVTGFPYPADYRISFASAVVDTSSAAIFGAERIPMKFEVRNITEDRKVEVVYVDGDGNRELSRLDEIYILEPDSMGQPLLTWGLMLMANSSSNPPPVSGDVYLFTTFKPIRTGDAFEFRGAAVTIARVEGSPLFSLDQNYPNPFNPSTTISFTVGSTGPAVLQVYNILGQRVATPFNGVAAAGQTYRLIFDGSKLASGVYFYRLQAGSFVQTRKLLLLK